MYVPTSVTDEMVPYELARVRLQLFWQDVILMYFWLDQARDTSAAQCVTML